MSTAATSLTPKERLAVLFEEVAELTGQRNAIDGRLVEIVAEIDRDGLCGLTGAASIQALVAWKLGATPRNAKTIAALARRVEEFPRCATALREGRLSLDQVGVIAERAADGSDEHYVEFAQNATVEQLRTAIKLEPKPRPEPTPDPHESDPESESGAEPLPPEPEPEAPRSIIKVVEEDHTTWTIRLPRVEAAKFEAGLRSHRDALIADWTRDHPDHDPAAAETDDRQRDAAAGHTVYDRDGRVVLAPPPDHGRFPTAVDAFISLIEAGWDVDVARRPHGQHTTVVVHLDVEERVGSLHLGPVLTDAERRFLTCDATCEAWFERHGQLIGSGRTTRQISRRLRRALEHRDRCCVVPGCGATRGLHAHHLRHWEDGGPTELWNLALVCPHHHRLHHRGVITITGPADHLVVTDADGQTLGAGSLARPPTTPPPAVPPYRGPTGERANWWWYQPFEPQPPPTAN